MGKQPWPLGTSTADQCHPVDCGSILLSQALIGSLALAWEEKEALSGGEKLRQRQAWYLPPCPIPTRGKMQQQADTILTLPQALSQALPAGWSGVRQAKMLLGMFVWLCAPVLALLLLV